MNKQTIPLQPNSERVLATAQLIEMMVEQLVSGKITEDSALIESLNDLREDNSFILDESAGQLILEEGYLNGRNTLRLLNKIINLRSKTSVVEVVRELIVVLRLPESKQKQLKFVRLICD